MIRLDDLLKVRGIADTGGQAKVLIQGGNVRVNGEIETRRGRQLAVGDKIEAGGQTIVVDETTMER